MTKHAFHCDSCGRNLAYESGITTGYGVERDTNLKACYACCASDDIEYMREHGKIALYLTLPPAPKSEEGLQVHRPFRPVGRVSWIIDNRTKITNWPGSLVFDKNRMGHCLHVKVGLHCVHGRFYQNRYDVWFIGPDGYLWHGVQYGDWTQIVHCKRTKERA